MITKLFLALTLAFVMTPAVVKAQSCESVFAEATYGIFDNQFIVIEKHASGRKMLVLATIRELRIDQAKGETNYLLQTPSTFERLYNSAFVFNRIPEREVRAVVSNINVQSPVEVEATVTLIASRVVPFSPAPAPGQEPPREYVGRLDGQIVQIIRFLE